MKPIILKTEDFDQQKYTSIQFSIKTNIKLHYKLPILPQKPLFLAAQTPFKYCISIINQDKYQTNEYECQKHVY